MLRKLNPFASEDKTFSWWWFGIQVGVVTALFVWWWFNQQKKKHLQSPARMDSLDDEIFIPLPIAETESLKEDAKTQLSPSKPDDLRKIEGIGPKIQTTLQAAGIQTFGQLAVAKPTELKQILVDAGIRIGYPETWTEQAALAAKNEWDALFELQSTLQGGRRIG